MDTTRVQLRLLQICNTATLSDAVAFQRAGGLAMKLLILLSFSACLAELARFDRSALRF